MAYGYGYGCSNATGGEWRLSEKNARFEAWKTAEVDKLMTIETNARDCSESEKNKNMNIEKNAKNININDDDKEPRRSYSPAQELALREMLASEPLANKQKRVLRLKRAREQEEREAQR